MPNDGPHVPTDNEAAIRYLEEHLPEAAAAAVRQAYWQTLAEGIPVTVREGDDLVEVSPDGTRRFVKRLEPLTPVPRGGRVDLG